NGDGSPNHAGTPTTDPEGLRRMMRDLPPRVGFNYDPGNIKAARPDDTTYGLDIIDSRINYCHLKDWTRKGDGWVAVAIGEDDMDYGSLLARMSFDGVYLIEYEPTHDVEDGIRRSLAHLGEVAPGYRLT
ncbi:MAG: sugar phosphate isomerase/epimerase, partial [Planctomycetes bacterium]|nr:sugar phosphate isomerase/epimerase [Planctomycetota bacterium]